MWKLEENLRQVFADLCRKRFETNELEDEYNELEGKSDRWASGERIYVYSKNILTLDTICRTFSRITLLVIPKEEHLTYFRYS